MTSFPPGYRIGHWTDAVRRTGCTVVIPPVALAPAGPSPPLLTRLRVGAAAAEAVARAIVNAVES